MGPVSVEEMRRMEGNAFASGVSVLDLMERAGRECARLIESKLETGNRILIFCGPGNNGGDGLVCARYLKQKYDVYIVVPIEPKTEAAQAKYQEAKNKQIRIISMDEVAFFKPDLIVDALLGIGARLPLRGAIKDACGLINSLDGFKVTIDIPSGMDAETGESDPDAVRPDATICIHAPKTGVIKAGEAKAGELWIADIGLS
jgi:NAD(P)H-hydrate epimerase